MQGEDESGGGANSPGRRCTSSADGVPGPSTVLIDSPVKSSCRRSPSSLPGARSGDGKTRRYVRSSEPRLKWTEELHHCFRRATAKLGGPEKATPKAILQEMNVRWLKIAHVKSHLQMYRNPKSGKSNNPPSVTSEVWNAQVTEMQQQQQQAGYRQYVQEEPDSWRRGPLIQHPIVTTVDVSTTSGRDREEAYYESPAQFSQMGHFGNVLSQSSDQGDDSRVNAEFFKMAEVLMESRTSKARDFETTDDADTERRLSDHARLYDSAAAAEALAHNLLMGMRERKLLEVGETQHATDPDHDDDDDAMVPLDLTMSVGASDPPNPNVRAEILTLDLTEKLNRPHP